MKDTTILESIKEQAPLIVLFAFCLALIAGLAMWAGVDPERELAQSQSQSAITSPLTPEMQAVYEPVITNPMNPIAVLETNFGTIELELFTDTMPITAGNFKKLIEEGYYDGIQFHRIIPNFMIQGGDPYTKTDQVLLYGTGGPGYAIPDEHIAGEHLTNVRGTVAMANSGPNSGGSQFFINHADNTFLDFDKPPLTSKHPVFGRVVKGMNIVDTITEIETNDRDYPQTPVVIERAFIKS